MSQEKCFYQEICPMGNKYHCCEKKEKGENLMKFLDFWQVTHDFVGRIGPAFTTQNEAIRFCKFVILQKNSELNRFKLECSSERIIAILSGFSTCRANLANLPTL